MRITFAFYYGAGAARTLQALACGETGVCSPMGLTGQVTQAVASWLMMRGWRAGDMVACCTSMWGLLEVVRFVAARYFVVEAPELRALCVAAIPLMASVWLLCWRAERRIQYRTGLAKRTAVQVVSWCCGAWGWSMASGASAIAVAVASSTIAIPVPLALIYVQGLIGVAGMACAWRGLAVGRSAVLGATFWALAISSAGAGLVEFLLSAAPARHASLILGFLHGAVFALAGTATYWPGKPNAEPVLRERKGPGFSL